MKKIFPLLLTALTISACSINNNSKDNNDEDIKTISRALNKRYYFYWMGVQLLFSSSGIIEIYFDLIAHNVLKKKKKRKKI